eukprot:1485441-Alexandrium_andersonii.AAC.1
MEQMFRAIKWSFDQLASGKWPLRDDLRDEDWAPGSYRQRRAGTWLAPLPGRSDLGYIAFITDALGDWAYIASVWKLPQYFKKVECCN